MLDLDLNGVHLGGTFIYLDGWATWQGMTRGMLRWPESLGEKLRMRPKSLKVTSRMRCSKRESFESGAKLGYLSRG